MIPPLPYFWSLRRKKKRHPLPSEASFSNDGEFLRAWPWFVFGWTCSHTLCRKKVSYWNENTKMDVLWNELFCESTSCFFERSCKSTDRTNTVCRPCVFSCGWLSWIFVHFGTCTKCKKTVFLPNEFVGVWRYYFCVPTWRNKRHTRKVFRSSACACDRSSTTFGCTWTSKIRIRMTSFRSEIVSVLRGTT